MGQNPLRHEPRQNEAPRRGLARLLAVAGLAACGVAAGGVTLATAGTHPATAATHPAHAPAASGSAGPRVLGCTGKPTLKPAMYVLACADYNSYFIGLHWSSWSSAGASASGTYRANDCEPDCAAGHFHDYPGTLRFTAPKETSLGVLFTEATFSYTTTESQSLPTRPLG